MTATGAFLLPISAGALPKLILNPPASHSPQLAAESFNLLIYPYGDPTRGQIEAVIMEYGLIQRFQERYNLLVVLGPTASGKTELAVRIARRIGGEIISADSRQVYRGMDLGTGKDLSQYGDGETIVPCHLIDILDPCEEFSVFDYQRLFYRCLQEITKRATIPLLVGGTGLYLDAVIRGYRMSAVPENLNLREKLEGEAMESLRRRLLAISPEVHNKTDLLERKRLIRAIEIAEFTRDHPYHALDRIPISPLVMGIRCEREALRRKITARLHSRLAAGLIEEVQSLHEGGIALGEDRFFRPGIPLHRPLPPGKNVPRRDDSNTHYTHPSVCQATGNLVQTNGTERRPDTLDRRTR